MTSDSAGHLYVDVENVRVTYVPAKDRSTEADWAGSDVIRIQAYKGQGCSLHYGAELPIGSPEVFIDLIAALSTVYRAGREASDQRA